MEHEFKASTFYGGIDANTLDPKAAATGTLDLRIEAHAIRIRHDEKGLATPVAGSP